MGIDSLKEELIKIEESVKANKVEALDSLLTKSLTIAVESESILKEVWEEL
jgi:hypothetical protein